LTAIEKGFALAATLEEKKGLDVRLLDLRGIQGFTDCFLIATGRSDRHVQALAQSVVTAVQQNGERPLGVEGEKGARWVLIDLGDVVVHVFRQEARDFYDLEHLWGDADPLALPRAAQL